MSIVRADGTYRNTYRKYHWTHVPSGTEGESLFFTVLLDADESGEEDLTEVEALRVLNVWNSRRSEYRYWL